MPEGVELSDPFGQPPPDPDPFGQAPTPTQNLSVIRNQQFQELRDNPQLVGDLFSLTHQEVGSQGPEAQQAFIETVFNRSAARGKTLEETMHDRGYYPKISFKPIDLNGDAIDHYGNLLSQVGQGSNISNGATGNASGKVGFGGGPITFVAGGEKFGVEKPDMGKLDIPTTEYAGPDLEDPFGKPTPSGPPEPRSWAQSNEAKLQDFVQGKNPMIQGVVEGLSKLIPAPPSSVEEGLTEGIQQALSQTLPGGVIASLNEIDNTAQEMAQLEDTKKVFGGGSPEYKVAAGRLAGRIIPQMAMGALGVKGLQPKVQLNPVAAGAMPLTEGVRGSGKFRPTYMVDKQLGDMMEGIGAAKESGGLRGEIAVRQLTDGLTPEQTADLGKYLVSRRLEQIRLQQNALGAQNAAAQGVMVPNTPPHPQILSTAEQARIMADPQIAKAVDYYANNIRPDIEQWRLQAGLTPEAAAGKDPEFISLIKNEEAVPKAYGKVQQASRLARKTRFAQKATGTAQEYNTNVGDIIKESYGDVIRKARVNAFYKAAHAKGLAEPVTIQTGDGPRSVINFDSLTPELQSQLRAATEVPPKATGVLKGVRAIQRGATSLALTANPAELVNHMRRQLEVMSTLPPIGKGLIARLELLLPYIGTRTGSFIRTVTQNANSPQFRAVLQDIFDAGGGSSRSFGNLYELRGPIAKYTGLKWLQRKTHNLLFSVPKGKGINGWDLRMRVQLEQIRRAVEGNKDPQRIREFANQIGQYGSHPDWIIGALRELNPYAATSLPMRWTELKQAIGLSGFKQGFWKRRFYQAETFLRGTGGTILALAAANYMLSGKWPWENDPGHETDLNTGLKSDDGKNVYVKLRVMAPGSARVVNTVGLPLLARERTVDKPDYLGALMTAFANQGLSIVGGPAQNAAWTAATGTVPYLVKTPGRAPNLMDVSQVQPGQSRSAEQLKQALKGLNPLAEGLVPTNAKRHDVEAPGLLKYLERPVGGFHGIKPFGDVFTQSYEKKQPKHPQTGSQVAATIKRKLRRQAQQQ